MLALKQAGRVRLALRNVPAAAPVPMRPVHPVRVAAISEPEQAAAPQQQPEAVQPSAQEAQAVTAEVLLQELNLMELDAAQEQLLAWMVDLSEDEQEEDLDEDVQYEELGDAEYEEVASEVERLMDEADSDLRVGDRVVGSVYEVDEEGAYIDIGQKASGFVPLAECSFAKLKSPLEVLRVGMRREFIVVDREDEFGQTVLSLAAMEATVFWQRIQQLYQEQVSVNVTVESANKGGLLVKYGPYEGFVPVSQFGPQIDVDNMEALVGQQLSVKFLEVDEERERLVFSHRKASGSAVPEGQQFSIGQVVEGVVQTVKPYGAFVDIGGTTGLLHVSQISSERVTNVEKVLSEGDRLKVMILGLDAQRGRVTLSTKKLEAKTGDMLTNPQAVYENAEKAAALFRERVDAARAVQATAQPGAAGQDPLAM